MKKLSSEQVLMLHSDLIKETGGLDGIRDDILLDFALEAPWQTIDGKEQYPTIQQKAACLGYYLIKDHVFIDGNKRVGIHIILIFLLLNEIQLSYTTKDLYHLIQNTASSQISYDTLLTWILQHQS